MAGVERVGPPRSKCAGCRFAGLCTPCRPQTGKLGKAKVSVVESPKELFSKESPGLREGFFIFGPASEKICSICKEAASTCSHSKSKTSALAA